MIRSFFTGLTGLRANQAAVDVISNNIANVNTTGYKSSTAYFQDLFSQNIGRSNDVNYQSQVGLGTRVAAIELDFSSGALQFTGSNLHFGLEGEGFFVIGDIDADYTGPIDGNVNDVTPGSNADRSELAYTRDGAFCWNSEGYLTTVDGNYVMKEEPKGSNLFVRIQKDDPANEDLTAVMAVAKFPNNNGLERMGGNLYRETNLSGGPLFGESNELGYATIRQQVLEMSNVDIGLEFTRMIIASRAFQANSRSISTSDEMLQELINIKR